MNAKIRRWTGLAVSLFIMGGVVMLPGIRVYAAGTVTVTTDSEAGAALGAPVTVTFEAASDGDGAEPPSITVDYDPNRLELTDAGGVEYGGGGGSVFFSDMSATLTFTTLSGGNAVVTVSAILDGDGAEVPTGSVTIPVEGEDTAALLSENAAVMPPSDTGVTAQTIPSSDSSVMISTVFPSEYMFPYFHKETIVYQGTQTEAAKFDMGDVVLLYTTDQSGQNGAFKIYNEASGELSDFRPIEGPEDKYIIILKAPVDVEPPAGYSKATLMWNDDQSFEAYLQIGDGEEAVNPDFFLLYAISSEGNTGWYRYDKVEGTYQRYDMDTAGEGVSEDEEEFSLFGIPLLGCIIIGVLALLVIIMLIILIISLLKIKEYESYEYIDEDEEAPPAMQGTEQAQVRPAGRQTGRIPPLEEPEDEELFDPRQAKKEKKEKEKKEKKKRPEESGSLDFEAMQSAMKSEDDRRPRGNEEGRHSASLPEQKPEKQPHFDISEQNTGSLPEPDAVTPSGPLARSVIDTPLPRQEHKPVSPAVAVVTAAAEEKLAEQRRLAEAEAAKQKKQAASQSPLKSDAKQTKAADFSAEPARPKQTGQPQPVAGGRQSAMGAGAQPSEEDRRREHLLQAAKQPEIAVEHEPQGMSYQNAPQYGGSYGQDPYSGNGGAYYGQGYGQPAYGQGGYGYQYGGMNAQYQYGQDQYGNQYYEPQQQMPTPSQPTYNREQFSAGPVAQGYAQNAYAQGQQAGVTDNTENFELDDDFEFEYLNMGDN
ncbi:MAG: hypothetical protein K6G83_02665 [Lachnospiraceae bacterium]|nr:hypothetical protein [Lachnospiraceae bacterium]